jgi:hypothetical protein
VCDHSLAWIELAYIEILRKERRDFELQAIMHGADPVKLAAQNPDGKDFKVPEAADLMKYGFGSAQHPRLLKNKKGK